MRKANEGEGDFRIVRDYEFWAPSPSAALPLEPVRIDMEGADIGVICGLTKTISEHKPLVCVKVLEESRWHAVRDLLTSVGCTSWHVIFSDSGLGGVFPRVWSALRGRTHQMVPLPSHLRRSGYDMFVCMARSHAANVGA